MFYLTLVWLGVAFSKRIQCPIIRRYEAVFFRFCPMKMHHMAENVSMVYMGIHDFPYAHGCAYDVTFDDLSHPCSIRSFYAVGMAMSISSTKPDLN
jgi:hypothetical protein